MDLFKKILKAYSKRMCVGENRRFSTVYSKLIGGQKNIDIELLKKRNLELEENIKKLSIQLEKSKKNVKNLTSKKQEVEEQINSANIKIKTLELELKKVKKEHTPSISFTFKESIPFRLIKDYLFKIQSIKSNEESLLTIYVPEKNTINSICELKDAINLIDEKSQYLLKDFNSNTGFVFFYDLEQMICELFIPPIPITTTFYCRETSFKVDIIQDVLKSHRKLCIIVLKRGDSFVGITSDNETFDLHKIIKSTVKSKHTKGGFSQRRFERLREEDINHHIQKVQSVCCDFLENELDIDYIISGGDIQLTEYMLNDMKIDIPIINTNIEVKVKKNNINDLLKNTLSGIRYKK